MTSYELAKRAIEFNGPERVPACIGEYDREDTDSDVLRLLYGNPKYGIDGKNEVLKLDDEGRDEWGCKWKSLDSTVGQVIEHPLDNWDKLKSYIFPDGRKEENFRLIKEKIKRCYKDKYILGEVPVGIFERMHILRGFSNLLEDLYLNKEKVMFLLDKIVENIEGIIEMWNRAGAHGIFFTDDWGTQENLIINPALWREIFMPRYEKLFSLVHGYGMHTALHSCGKVDKILPDLIKVGLDIFNTYQPTVMGIDYLGNHFGGKICFLCSVDIQNTLTRGTREDVKAEAEHLIDAFSRYNGGFICAGFARTGEGVDFGVSLENILIMNKTFREYGKKMKPGIS